MNNVALVMTLEKLLLTF